MRAPSAFFGDGRHVEFRTHDERRRTDTAEPRFGIPAGQRPQGREIGPAARVARAPDRAAGAAAPAPGPETCLPEIRATAPTPRSAATNARCQAMRRRCQPESVYSGEVFASTSPAIACGAVSAISIAIAPPIESPTTCARRIERREERDQVAGMLLDRERFAPPARAEAAQVRHQQAVTRGEIVALKAPVVVAAAEAVDQQDRRALALVHAGELDPIDVDALHRTGKLHRPRPGALTSRHARRLQTLPDPLPTDPMPLASSGCGRLSMNRCSATRIR